jgi:PAP2 superfamily
MRLLGFLLNGPMFGVLTLFLSVIWMLRNQKDRTRPLLVFALVLNLFYGFLLNTFMGHEGALFPWKYDPILFRMDESLGIQAVLFARHLQGPLRLPLWYIYQLMVPMMIVWFLVTQYGKPRGSIVLAYIAEMVAGPLLYAILPACGPIYAFGKQWLQPSAVSLARIQLTGLPNAFPSLHVGTAFVFVLFAPGKWSRAVALVFLVLTGMATIGTGEHYVIDLIPGLAFGAFSAAVASQHYRRAALFLAIVLAWSLSVRFGYAFFVAYPAAIRTFVVLTLVAVIVYWSQSWIRSVDLSAMPARPAETGESACTSA